MANGSVRTWASIVSASPTRNWRRRPCRPEWRASRPGLEPSKKQRFFLRFAPGGITETGEAEQHHRPGRGLGDGDDPDEGAAAPAAGGKHLRIHRGGVSH